MCCVPGSGAGGCLDLTFREMEVCKLVCASQSPIRFSVLKRATGMHQTVLTRIIHTLEVHRVIEKTPEGYARVGQ